jgi:hypothetical protein
MATMIDHHLRLASFFLCALVALPSCNKGTHKVYPVQGRVIFKDTKQPLTAGIVEFESHAENEKLRINARGAIETDGTFRLTTFEDNDGAVLGPHRVVVIPPIEGQQLQKTPKLLVDARFMDYDKSGLRATVTTNPEENQFVFEVEKPKVKP